MSAIRCCFDRVLPRELMRLQPTVPPPGNLGRARGVAVRGKSWANGSTLRVRFLGGSAAERAAARTQAGWWEAACNLRFDFNDAPDAEIRIAFDTGDGAWSYIGTDSRDIPLDQPTMNLGFEEGGTAAHEFGHAIGLAHEHQNPQAGIQWDVQKVIRAMAGSPNFWDEATTRHNILRKYSLDQIHSTEFDPKSIMLYFFPDEWTTNGVGTRANAVLSAMDKAFVAGAKMYPRDRPALPDAVELTVDGARLQASIGQPGEEDLYRFRAPADGGYLIDTRGPTDVYMKLFGPNSPTALIAEDDDGGYGLNPRITAPLVAGDYLVQIRHYEGSGTGRYTIGVKRR